MHRFLALFVTLVSCAHMPAPVTLPAEITAALPPDCRQVLLVTVADQHTSAAELTLLELTPSHTWSTVGNAIPARIGRNGMAWGHGEFSLHAPPGWRVKKEGDGCAPAGVFRIVQAFGDGPQPSGIRLPWLHCTTHHWGIDDVRSRHYNQIVDDRVTPSDWTGPETMVPAVGCYKLGAVIAHNPRNTPGLGSCIFMHVWQGREVPTAGCTAMSEPDLRNVLAWLDPHAYPCLVQLVQKP